MRVVLTESDIPGAKIPRGTVEECRVFELKRWLLCRGGKTTGNKSALVKRSVSVIDFVMCCSIAVVPVVFNCKRRS